MGNRSSAHEVSEHGSFRLPTFIIKTKRGYIVRELRQIRGNFCYRDKCYGGDVPLELLCKYEMVRAPE